MTVLERVDAHSERREIAVTVVDTDVHPLPISTDVLKSYAPAEWVGKIWPTGNAVTPVPHFYDTPDSYKTMSLRLDAAPPDGGLAGSDPDFAAKQLLVEAGVSIASLEPMCDAQLPQAEHVLKSTYNDWLADVWLGKHNAHGRWRGSIMRGTATALYGLPATVKALPGEPLRDGVVDAEPGVESS